ncbi:hypothetical protein DFP72DRAFT_802394 [Ephemerocybe angulata]|uniref:Uncharacterized protein n=1 Tax=Ephemerocybe angulata TaxID=980116 RepID=A0A8H6MFZ2_9AGAR|nr:hypothetical protein DFP72DRAFT_834350 [Tulosesus angulatus]KAF6762917.1 hypothetical protein DFP72DRAFT_802394 [Tulosesus angulatus]
MCLKSACVSSAVSSCSLTGLFSSRSDPLVHYGRHWGRTVSTFCPIFGLVRDGMERKQRLGDDLEAYEDQVDAREARDHRLYRQLFLLVPKLEERLGQSSDEEIHYICNMLTRGVNSARSDDTKSLKAALVDWITPPGGVLTPPIQRNVKTDRGFHHPRTGELLCPPHWDWNDPKIREGLKSGELVPSGVHFPVFLYQDFKYPGDAKVWDGLFKSRLLVNAYKHVFTSPSSVGEKGSSRATRSSNARIHGMKSVTIPSIAYIATQVRFALHSQSTFLRTDLVTDSEYFYDSVVALLEDMKERQEVNELLTWWNL